jgi:hypothetical protein
MLLYMVVALCPETEHSSELAVLRHACLFLTHPLLPPPAGLAATVRTTRGLEAAAACGQLRNQHQKVPLAEFAALS